MADSSSQQRTWMRQGDEQMQNRVGDVIPSDQEVQGVVKDIQNDLTVAQRLGPLELATASLDCPSPQRDISP
jgi:hypothetical protein